MSYCTVDDIIGTEEFVVILLVGVNLLSSASACMLLGVGG